ncbi:hypothetical protein FA95DRAFT_1613619 [Auriscalpium vulgare]|uniref:Uncharacterized protein n=1 Tax=Auriscalpium vulgare TaxID=40419 RepID=A0ACB8R1X4_9AGAM|nr:hypothetical protein FA95DRAFT_1613619 [Auriscalpium vulgare]
MDVPGAVGGNRPDDGAVATPTQANVAVGPIAAEQDVPEHIRDIRIRAHDDLITTYEMLHREMDQLEGKRQEIIVNLREAEVSLITTYEMLHREMDQLEGKRQEIGVNLREAEVSVMVLQQRVADVVQQAGLLEHLVATYFESLSTQPGQFGARLQAVERGVHGIRADTEVIQARMAALEARVHGPGMVHTIMRDVVPTLLVMWVFVGASMVFTKMLKDSGYDLMKLRDML